jgi:hypothetical protein
VQMANLASPLVEHAIIHFLVSEKLQKYLGICHDHGHHCHHETPSTGSLFAYNIYNGLHTLIHLAGFKGLIDHMLDQNSVMQTMQKELIDIRACLENAHEIYELLQAHPEIIQSLPGFDKLQALFTDSKQLSSELHEFITLIQRDTFAGNPSFFSRSGIILRAYALGQKIHAELKDILTPIAAIDFYCGTAQLMNASHMSETPFTFTQFYEQEKPLLIIKGFWNPLIDNHQPIQEIISLGSQEPHIAIVTGPNKAGKSTSLATLCLAIVLSQTLGIAPALECHLTPFSCIRTGFNMTSRVSQGQSLFSASLDFANNLLTHARTHKNQFILLAIDELFNSTDFQRGSVIARRFANALDTCGNCIALMATHFGTLTQLEEENPCCYKNFKAELIMENHQPRYILEPGISEKAQVLRLIDPDILTAAQ